MFLYGFPISNVLEHKNGGHTVSFSDSLFQKPVSGLTISQFGKLELYHFKCVGSFILNLIVLL